MCDLLEACRAGTVAVVRNGLAFGMAANGSLRNSKLRGVGMPIVRAAFWSGASLTTKNAIAASITDVMVEHLSCPRSAVTVILEEIDKDDWFIGGVDSVTLTSEQ